MGEIRRKDKKLTMGENRPTALEYSKCIRNSLEKPNRIMAPFQYYGGKGNLAKWIVKHIPRGDVYVEPFSGAASVFWHLPRPYSVEVLNDLDSEIINLFRVLQDEVKFNQLAHRLTWTPYSLDEFRRALNTDSKDPVTRAWAFFVKMNQGFDGTFFLTEGQWSRVFTSDRGMAGTTNRWERRLSVLDVWHKRLMRVQLDNRPALDVIKYWDSKGTVFYIDPPYAPKTRKDIKVYTHEFSEADHIQLLKLLLNVKGKVVISGYKNPVYELFEENGWERFDRNTACYATARTRRSGIQGKGAALAKVPRVESIWVSPSVMKTGQLNLWGARNL